MPKTAGESIETALMGRPNWEKDDPNYASLNLPKDSTVGEDKHYTISQWKDHMCFDSYFKFTFVRNPYTRLASVYEHGIRKGIYKSTFSDLLTKESKSDIWLMPQYFFTKAGSNKQKKISFIGKYENLKKDIKHIFNTIGVNNYKLPHLNRNPIYDRHPHLKQEGYYKTFYSEDWMIDWVKERYKNDFKIFNYGMELPR